ncbi:MAG: GIY-YIG nuclease family protein [Chloroflexi bacterium]|nr:MAG: GIY-YIG nuclease family protein [Chloroflexota bacterium]HEY66983.1 GIY-YIG nuclease family protein [Thermoflexia bacterium]
MPPDRSGTYVLVLRLPRSATVTVGRLGRFRFPAGWYAYVGSACGPGGLAARVTRHLREPKPRHWHVDYLRACAWPVAIWYAVGIRKRECTWARVLSDLPGASIPVPRFGASDCRCPAHLIHFGSQPSFDVFARAVGEPLLQETLNV